RSPCPCDRTKINALDRGIAGRRSDSADRASDIAAGLVLTAPFAIDALDVRGGEGARQALGTDAAAILESIAVDTGLNHLVKAVTHRPRPLLYGLPAAAAADRETDNYRSFYSHHTSAAFATGICYARTFEFRHPAGSSRRVVWGAAIL